MGQPSFSEPLSYKHVAQGNSTVMLDLAVAVLLQVPNVSDGIFRASAIALSITVGHFANHDYYLHAHAAGADRAVSSMP